MLRSEEVNKFILYIPVTSSTQIIEIIGNHKLIHFYPTGRNDFFSKEQRELEKERSKLKFILTEYNNMEKYLREDGSKVFTFDLDDTFNKLVQLKEIQANTSRSIQKITEDLFTLKEASSTNEFYLVGTLENEKSFLFEKVLYEVLKRNVIFKSQDIPSLERITVTNEVNESISQISKSEVNEFIKEKPTGRTEINFDFPTKSTRKSYQILLHSEETFTKVSKIFESLGGRILSKEKMINKHKNILHCSTLLAQLKKIYVNNEININYLLNRSIPNVKEIYLKNYREIKVYTFLSECYFNKNSFVAVCFVPKRFLYKFRKIVEYVNQEYSLAIEEKERFNIKTENKNIKTEIENKINDSNINDCNISDKISDNKNINDNSNEESNIKNDNTFNDNSNKNKNTNKNINDSIYDNINDKTIEDKTIEDKNINDNINSNKNTNKNIIDSNDKNIDIKNDDIKNNIENDDFIPPSYFHTGKFTRVYQDLTNTFEIPKYGEVNPGIFTIFFFPFFFGMMFSDILHGLILLSLGISLIYSEKINKYFRESELLRIVENAKYLLISMGAYSVYFGLLFCDFGGVELNYPYSKVIFFGVKEMKDKKEFINRLKMKMSIVLGALHMFAGIILGFVNKSDNLISLCAITVSYLCFVGYLVFLIFYKWICEVNVSLINELVEMYTKPFDKKTLFLFQREIQLFIIIALLTSMLVLFLNKPIRDVKNVDLWVEQSIHSIEYGVSLVSNTASYLRLWAVSLAHGTLTEILHQQTFARGLIIGTCALPIYLSMTFGLLIGLEGTSATLHSLRLNWIEFSSKFMKGGGVEYKAFSFDEEEC